MSLGSNSNSSESVSLTSVIGLISEKIPFNPDSISQLNDSCWTAIKSGNSKTFSRFPNEYRSRSNGRADNNKLPAEGDKCGQTVLRLNHTTNRGETLT